MKKPDEMKTTNILRYWRRTALALGLSTAAACAAHAGDAGFDPADDAPSPASVESAKADDGTTRTLRLGQSARATVGGTQPCAATDPEEIDGSCFRTAYFAVDLPRSTVTIRARRASGDVVPAAYVYRSTGELMRPDEFEATSESLDMTFYNPHEDYEDTESTTFYIAVKARRHVGEGDVEIVVCSGDRCAFDSDAGMPTSDAGGGSDADAGPPDGGTLDAVAAGECLSRAAACSIGALDGLGAAPDRDESEALFRICLEDAGAGCAAACSHDASAAELCEQIPFTTWVLGRYGSECALELDACLDACGDAFQAAEEAPDSVSETPAYRCWLTMGNCREHVEQARACNPRMSGFELGSPESCASRCAVVTSAGSDAVDSCLEACSGT
ncbi:MAG: hypothetical protein ACK5U8_07860 [Deltaproteobacteria bacterium]